MSEHTALHPYGSCSMCGAGLPPTTAAAHQCVGRIAFNPTVGATTGGALSMPQFILNPPPTDLHSECLSTISDLREQIEKLRGLLLDIHGDQMLSFSADRRIHALTGIEGSERCE